MHSRQIHKQFIRYVIPAVVGMVVQALYVILDGIIVGQGIGEVALAAINIAFPCTMVVIALAMLIAVGGANVYSFYKGQGEAAKANNIFNQCMVLTVAVGMMIAVGGYVFRYSLALLFGANATLLPPTVAYLQWVAPFALLQMLVCVLATFIRNDEAPRLVMTATVTGAIINALLDVLFIIVWDYGIEAAAITNGIGMMIELAFYAVHFIQRQGVLRFEVPRFHAAELKRICSNGLATFLMEFSLPAITLSFNLAIIHTAGTLGITAYSIVGYVCAIINMTLVGVTSGAQPLMSLCHGNGNTEDFHYVYRLGIRANILIPTVLVGVCMAFGSQIVALFRGGNPELTALTTHMLRLYPLAHIAIGTTLMNVLYFQTTERNGYSAIISLLRCVGFIQIFLLISLYLFDGRGLYLTFAAGEICHLLLSIVMVRRSENAGNSGRAAVENQSE